MGAYSPTAGLPLSTAVSRFAENLAQFPRGGHPKQEGGPGIGGVSEALSFSVYHPSLFYYPVEFK